MRPAIKNICKNAGVVCYNIADKFNTGGYFCEPTFAHSIMMFADNGYRMLWTRIWDKKRQALSSSAPYHLSSTKPIGDAEYIAAFSNANISENGNDTEIDVSDYSFISTFANGNHKFVKRLSKAERREWGYSSMWRIVSCQGKKGKNEHHATFPVELPWRCVKMHSDKGDIVLEPFSGTFTTGLACEQTERRCFAIERDTTYCDMAVKRYADFVKDAEIYLLRDGERIPLVETGLLTENNGGSGE